MWNVQFLIWEKSNLKKCLWEPNSAAPQQVLCHGSMQGACSVSERFDLPQSHVKPRGVAGMALRTRAHHAVHSARTCSMQAGNALTHLLWPFCGSCCTPNQWVWNSQWGLQDGFVCVVTPSSPITISESHLTNIFQQRCREDGLPVLF